MSVLRHPRSHTTERSPRCQDDKIHCNDERPALPVSGENHNVVCKRVLYRLTCSPSIKSLEEENARLNKLLAEAMLDKEALLVALGRKY